MAFFKRKSKEEDVDEELDEGVDKDSRQKKLFKKKDFKDLNSKDKKARREPKKPWGKKERLLVISLLLLTAGISSYLWLTSIGWKFPKLGNFPKIDYPALNVFKEETIIIENFEKTTGDSP